MPRNRLFRSLFVLIVAALLCAPSAWAAPNRELHTFDIFAHLWSTVSALWAKAGCMIDPHGSCLPSAKEGCNLDPHGGCAPPSAKEGCMLDPHGACITEQPAQQLSADEGCNIDPHGSCAPGS